MKPELLGVVVDLLYFLQHQTDETLVTTREALDSSVTGLSGDVLRLIFRRRGVGAGTATVHHVPSANTGSSSGDTTIDGSAVGSLRSLGGIATKVL